MAANTWRATVLLCSFAAVLSAPTAVGTGVIERSGVGAAFAAAAPRVAVRVAAPFSLNDAAFLFGPLLAAPAHDAQTELGLAAPADDAQAELGLAASVHDAQAALDDGHTADTRSEAAVDDASPFDGLAYRSDEAVVPIGFQLAARFDRHLALARDNAIAVARPQGPADDTTAATRPMAIPPKPVARPQPAAQVVARTQEDAVQQAVARPEPTAQSGWSLEGLVAEVASWKAKLWPSDGEQAAPQAAPASGLDGSVNEKALSLAALVEERAPVMRSALAATTAPQAEGAPPSYRLATLTVGKGHAPPPVRPFQVEDLGLNLAPGSSAASLGQVLERASHHPQRLKSALTDQSVPFSQVVSEANREAETVPPWLAMTPKAVGADMGHGNRRALVQSLRLVDARNRDSGLE